MPDTNPKPYNPLDYDNLTANCVRELLTRGPVPLPIAPEFSGAGVYALFYVGDFTLYEPIRSPDASHPIYVGKAVPPGGRKGAIGMGGAGKALFRRLQEHAASIQAADNLRLEHFRCRYLVVEPLWIVMAERFLIDNFRPLWNVCLEGFGNHDPGSGRHQGEITWWDALHPGRPWSARLRQTKTAADAETRARAFLQAPEERQARIAFEALESGEADE